MASHTAYRSRQLETELLRHTTQLRAFAISMCGDTDAGNDLVQDTLLKAITNLNRFQPDTNMRAWLFTILRNTYFTQCRRDSFQVRDEDGLIAEAQFTEAPQDSQAEFHDFERALRALNAEQREALILVGAGGLTYDEVAEIVGCSSGTVKSRVNRARAKLQQLLYSDDLDALKGGRMSTSSVTGPSDTKAA
ncbi:MAG: sigma-70 family RNA polymerase sigma factor [Pseudomonadota bacterium]